MQQTAIKLDVMTVISVITILKITEKTLRSKTPLHAGDPYRSPIKAPFS
jgi:hypothetical protein